MRKALVLLAAAACCAVGPAARADTVGPCPAGARQVSMKDFKFAPDSLTVDAGQAVCWTYDESPTDPMPNCESVFLHDPSPLHCPGHSTTAVDTAGGKPLWDSGVHRADGFPFTHLFTKPGTYRYYCTVHGGEHPNNPLTHMDGTIVVGGGPVVSPPHVLGSQHRLPGTGAGFEALPGFAMIALGVALRRLALR